MKFYNIIIKYRFWLSILVVLIGVALNLTGTGFWLHSPFILLH